MSPWMVPAIIVGLFLIGLGIETMTRVIQQHHADNRRPGPLVDRPEKRLPIVRPTELEVNEQLVDDTISSEATARHHLLPLLAELAEHAPHPAQLPPMPRRDRRRWIVETLDELEQAWGLD
ncbi:MAG: hypothetical protein GY929_15435 [Actinomycetia bacterium]|nr:hypothetical protein [Actinomycetes bacterium]